MNTPTHDQCTHFAKELMAAVLWHLTELKRHTSIQHKRSTIATTIFNDLVRGDVVPMYSNGDVLLQQGESCLGWIFAITQYEASIVAEKPETKDVVYKMADAFDLKAVDIISEFERTLGLRIAVQIQCPGSMIASGRSYELRDAINTRQYGRKSL
jgi:hypothetical protein